MGCVNTTASCVRSCALWEAGTVGKGGHLCYSSLRNSAGSRRSNRRGELMHTFGSSGISVFCCSSSSLMVNKPRGIGLEQKCNLQILKRHIGRQEPWKGHGRAVADKKDTALVCVDFRFFLSHSHVWALPRLRERRWHLAFVWVKAALVGPALVNGAEGHRGSACAWEGCLLISVLCLLLSPCYLWAAHEPPRAEAEEA